MNFIRTSYSTYYRKKREGWGVYYTNLPWGFKKLIEKSFHSDAITYLSRIVQKMIPTQTNFTLNYD